jgi:hypothetical protein
MLLLCWWHVLRAWQQHFITTSFPELWDVLKSWIRITDETEFNKSWAKVQESFTEYIITYWLPGAGYVVCDGSTKANSL